MKLTIFGSTGRIGRHALARSIAAGHDTTAVVRDPRRLAAEVRDAPNLRIVTADLSAPDLTMLTSASHGADAVLSDIGPRKKAEHGIVSTGTRAIVKAMSAAGVHRLIVISGVGVSTVPTPSRPNPPKREPGAGWIMRYLSTPLAKIVLGQHFVDVALMEDYLRACDLDWTVIRIPFVVDKPATGAYRTAYGHNLRAAFRITQADAAECMLRFIGQTHTVRQVITIAQ